MPARIMSASEKSKKRKKTFQERLEELQSIVEELESGDLSLEDAISRFEAGQKLHARLLEELDGYEKRIEKLVKGSDGEDRLEAVPAARRSAPAAPEEPGEDG